MASGSGGSARLCFSCEPRVNLDVLGMSWPVVLCEGCGSSVTPRAAACPFWALLLKQGFCFLSKLPLFLGAEQAVV